MDYNLHLLCEYAPHIHISTVRVSSKSAPSHKNCGGRGMLGGAGPAPWVLSMELLLSAILILYQDFLQAVIRSVRCSTCFVFCAALSWRQLSCGNPDCPRRV